MTKSGEMACRRASAVFAIALRGLLLGGCAGTGERAALTETDRQSMDRAAQEALEFSKIGQGSNWSNPDSGHVGSITPLRTYETDSGRPCRDYQQTVTMGGKTGLAHDTACRQPNGTWISANYRGLAGFDSYRPSYASGYRDYRYYDPYYGYPYYGHHYFGFGHRYGHHFTGYGFGHGYGYPHYRYGQHRRHSFSFGYGVHFGS